PEGTDTWTRDAAGWLREYLQKVSGANLSIVNEDRAPTGRCISVGHTRLAAAANLASRDWKWDTCWMAARGDVLFLLGRDEPDIAGRDRTSGQKIGAAGTCKAVVSFLEDFCGVR